MVFTELDGACGFEKAPEVWYLSPYIIARVPALV